MLNLGQNNKISNYYFKRLLKSITAQKELVCLELNLNNTCIYFSEIVGLIYEIKINKSLEKLAL